jgi:hypothetical protein
MNDFIQVVKPSKLDLYHNACHRRASETIISAMNILCLWVLHALDFTAETDLDGLRTEAEERSRILSPGPRKPLNTPVFNIERQ